MTRLLAVATLLLTLGASGVAVAGGGPRAEKERLTPADMALAKRIVLRRADLGPGWKEQRLPADEGDVQFSCPGYTPDFSAFTITGKASTGFVQASGSSLIAYVEIYETRSQAIGDFRTGARPGFGRCLRVILERELKKAGSAARFSVVSSRMVSAPRLGERSAAFRVVVRVSAGAQSLRIYLDVVVVQKGRAHSGLMAIALTKPLAEQSSLAAKMASRMS